MAAGADRVDGLADAVGCRPTRSSRVLRLLAMYGVVTEVTDGRYRPDAARRSTAERCAGIAPIVVRHERAGLPEPLMTAPLDSLLTGAPVFEQVMGLTVLRLRDRRPCLGRSVRRADGRGDAGTAAAVVDAYEFDGIERLVDVGGGNGTLLAAILRAHPRHARCSSSTSRPSSNVRCRRSRHRTSPIGSTSSPVTSSRLGLPAGDAYLLSWIIHDWDDDDARRILANCRRAIGDGRPAAAGRGDRAARGRAPLLQDARHRDARGPRRSGADRGRVPNAARATPASNWSRSTRRPRRCSVLEARPV